MLAAGILTAVAVTMMTAAPAHAAALKRWQGHRWHTSVQGGVTVTKTRTALRFSLPATPTGDQIATYYTKCKVNGNFAAQVRYQLTTWPPANGVRVGLLVNNPNYPTQTDSVTTERTSFGASGDVGVGESYIQNAISSGGGFVVEQTAALSGTLRIVDHNGILTSKYRDATTGGQFLTMTDSGSAALAHAPDYGQRVSLGLQVWSGLNVFAGPAKVTLTRFRITSGVCR